MHTSNLNTSTDTGPLIKVFAHGKGLVVFTLLFSIVMLALAGFVLYLSTILPTNGVGGSGGSNPVLLIYAASGFLVVLAAVLFGIHLWQKKLRGTQYEVYEQGIAAIDRAGRHYTPYAEIEDLYLFASGQTAFTGLITNLAYRRTERDPFHRVIASLKSFHEFQQLVRELHVRARVPIVLSALESGEAVTFRFVDTGQVWGKRMGGDFLNIKTQSITMTREWLEVEGRKLPLSSLASVDLNTWSEKVTLVDEHGKPMLSTIATGILSHDVFLATLEVLLHAK
ncbi:MULTISPECIES: hypothetical protein [unclassified Pseudomonas]|uniref:hypothetical protein n=1 Tax=unclassified Pseudomonas TaxID=196821 RepID=UPI000D37F1A8|nr:MULTISPECIES: hypothetical protein [unclassified Pseudomonas]RAU47879.1 hypothetical protein DBP26_004805 [Pseudomonas sp. RIT 409]RAU55427.1 hypothetical protein DBY65_005860 [Pseudomonas sp. RIT 412]